jgi:hypothetical protein
MKEFPRFIATKSLERIYHSEKNRMLIGLRQAGSRPAVIIVPDCRTGQKKPHAVIC